MQEEAGVPAKTLRGWVWIENQPHIAVRGIELGPGNGRGYTTPAGIYAINYAPFSRKSPLQSPSLLILASPIT